MNKNGVYGFVLAFGAGFAAFADDLAVAFFATAFLAAVFCWFGLDDALAAGFAAFTAAFLATAFLAAVFCLLGLDDALTAGFAALAAAFFATAFLAAVFCLFG